MQRANKFFLSVLSCLILAVSQVGILSGRAASTIYYVATTGANTDTCGTQIEPCSGIQKAINLASSGDIILVAGGVYSNVPDSPRAECYSFTSAKSIACIVNEHLTIRGGYSTSNWSVSDPVANPTIIDGLGQYRGITVLGSSNTTPLASLTLENFTIQNCRAQGNPTASGGGMLVDKANFTIRNVIFQNNKSIGANSTASGGTSSGGGLTISDMPSGTTGTLENLTFFNNEARGGNGGGGSSRGGLALGGGFYVWKGHINASYITVTNNVAQGGPATGTGRDPSLMVAEAAGGGFSIHDGDAEMSHLLVSENSAIGGSATNYAGGGYGGGIELEYDSYLRIADSTVQNNHALGGNAQYAGMAGGGGFLWDRTTVILDRVRVIGNTGKGGTGTTERGSAVGGGIHAMRSSGSATISILNSIIADNSLEFGDGTGTAIFGAGGGMFIEGYPANIIHTTFSGNQLSPEPEMFYGLAITIKSMATPSNVNLSHSIVAHHLDNNPYGAQAALVAWSGNTFNLTRNLFAGNTLDTNINNIPAVDGGPGTFNGIATTLYSSSAGFISIGAPYYNYHIAYTSSGKDQATTSTTTVDFELDNRPFGSVRDIGADEYYPFSLSVYPFRTAALYLDCRNDAQGTYPQLTGVDHYEVIVTCPAGANPPDQGSCNTPIFAGTEAHFVLTGLSLNVQYSVSVQAKNSSGATLATSVQAVGTPISMTSVFLPLINQ